MVLAIAIVSVTVCVQLYVVRLVYITCTLIYIQEYTFTHSRRSQIIYIGFYIQLVITGAAGE